MSSQMIAIDQYLESQYLESSMKHLNSKGIEKASSSNNILIVVAKTVFLYMFRYRSRKQLASMPQHRLDDIGVSKQQAMEEAAKWFWQE